MSCALKTQPRTLPSGMEVRLGINELDQDAVDVRVASITTPPSYTASAIGEDIAVLRLTQPVTFSRRVAPICLPEADVQVEDADATVVGKLEKSNAKPPFPVSSGKKIQRKTYNRSPLLALSRECRYCTRQSFPSLISGLPTKPIRLSSKEERIISECVKSVSRLQVNTEKKLIRVGLMIE